MFLVPRPLHDLIPEPESGVRNSQGYEKPKDEHEHVRGKQVVKGEMIIQRAAEDDSHGKDGKNHCGHANGPGATTAPDSGKELKRVTLCYAPISHDHPGSPGITDLEPAGRKQGDDHADKRILGSRALGHGIRPDDKEDDPHACHVQRPDPEVKISPVHEIPAVEGVVRGLMHLGIVPFLPPFVPHIRPLYQHILPGRN